MPLQNSQELTLFFFSFSQVQQKSILYFVAGNYKGVVVYIWYAQLIIAWKGKSNSWYMAPMSFECNVGEKNCGRGICVLNAYTNSCISTSFSKKKIVLLWIVCIWSDWKDKFKSMYKVS